MTHRAVQIYSWILISFNRMRRTCHVLLALSINWGFRVWASYLPPSEWARKRAPANQWPTPAMVAWLGQIARFHASPFLLACRCDCHYTDCKISAAKSLLFQRYYRHWLMSMISRCWGHSHTYALRKYHTTWFYTLVDYANHIKEDGKFFVS